MRYGSLIAILLLAGIGLPSARAGTTQPSTQPAGQVVAEFKIQHWGDNLLIPVEHQGKQAFFILDTGSTYSAVDAFEFPGLEPVGSRLQMDSAGGEITVQKYEAPGLYVGPISLQDCGPVLRQDLSTFTAIEGVPIVGILGTPAIKGFVIQIDADQHCIRLMRPDRKSHPEWGPSHEMRFDSGGRPSIEATIAGARHRILIDSGSCDCMDVPTQTFDGLCQMKGGPTLKSPSATANGTVELRKMRVFKVDLLDLRYHDLIYSETLGSNPAIGLQFLERHLVTLDLPAGRLYLKPGKDFGRRTEESMSGIHLLRRDKDLVAKIVDQDSPGFKAGIRSGDYITDLNGKPAGDYEMADVGDLMRSGDGKQITVTFLHQGDKKTVTFKLHAEI